LIKPGKPLYGDPCNGCGQCCLAEQCPISMSMFGDVGICPALVDAGDVWRCGLIVKPDMFFPHIPERMAEMTAGMLGVWSGRCDASDGEADDARHAEFSAILHAEAAAERPRLDKIVDDVLATLREIKGKDKRRYA
jgi:hypothetical protein